MRRPVDFVSLVILSVLAFGAWAAASLTAGSPWAPWLDNLHWTVATIGGAFLAWNASRKSKRGTAGWRLRLGTAWALALYGAGQLLWDFRSLGGGETYPGPSDALYLFLGPLMSLSLYQSWKVRPGSRSIRGVHLDSTLMTVGILALALAAYLPHSSGGNWLQLAVMLAYPATLFGAFSLGLVLSLHDSGPFHAGRIVTLAALFGTSFSWMGWNLSTLSGTTADGTLLNLSFGVFALALGASVGTWSWSRRTGSTGWKAGVLVLLPLTGPLLGALGYGVAVTDPDMPSSLHPLFAGLALLLLGLSTVRQWTLFQELKLAHFHRDRNAELEDALHQLRKTQDQLVQTAKLSALGQLIAGITHDLNSPLGAIRSSSSLLPTVLKESLAAQGCLEQLTAEQTRVLQALCEALSPEIAFLDSRAERTLRRDLALRASELDLPRPDALASALVESGLASRDDLVALVFALDDPHPVLAALEPLGTANRLASVILHATERASSVVVSLHNFLRTGADGERLWVEVGQSVRDVLPLFQHRLKQGLTLSTSFHGEAMVSAWPDKLSQVWVNLLTNAVQAVGDSGHIDVAVRVIDGHATVSVADDGPGVPADVRDRIFEAFFTTKEAGEGTGLGLEVCRRVVEELGGEIVLESRPGRTVFEVRLPLAAETP